jgi:hypothetical protein
VNREGQAPAAYAFAAANLGVGALNYLFQVHAVAVLPPAAFGALASWLAGVTVVSSVAAVLQLLSLESSMSARRLRATSRAAVLVAALVLVVHGVAWRGSPRSWLGALSVGGACALAVVVGQLQGRLRLGRVAAVLVVTGLARFAYPFAWPAASREHAFYIAHALACFAGLVLAGLFGAAELARGAVDPRPAGSTSSSPGVRRSILLAVAGMLLPSIDVLAVSFAHGAATTGAYSRIALVSRVVFFGGAALVQMLLPYEVRRVKAGEPLPEFAARAKRLLAPVMLALALAGSTLGELLVFRAMTGDERVWLHASCLSAGLLVVALGVVQRLATSERLRAAASCVACLAAVSGLAAVASSSVTRYVVAAPVGYAVVLAACVLGARSRFRQGPI